MTDPNRVISAWTRRIATLRTQAAKPHALTGEVTEAALSGVDPNPFISQKVSGNQVAIDPTYGLNDTTSTSSGSCTASCLKVSTASVAGQCCSCNGSTMKLSRSPWSAVTYVCQ